MSRRTVIIEFIINFIRTTIWMSFNAILNTMPEPLHSLYQLDEATYDMFDLIVDIP